MTHTPRTVLILFAIPVMAWLLPSPDRRLLAWTCAQIQSYADVEGRSS